MLEGLYSAASGMAAQQQRMEALANDVANVSTSGYKRARVSFRDLVYNQAGFAARNGVRSGAGVAAAAVGHDFAQGALRETGSPLDLAIEGRGFFRVQRPDGTAALTRDGSFRMDARGRLTTASGGLVMPRIDFPRGTRLEDVSVQGDGTVFAAGRRVGRLEIVDVRSPDGLDTAGNNEFTVTEQSGPAAAAPRARVQAGMLEASGVEIADVMVSMMESQRAYGMASKAIQTQDTLLEIANGVKR